MEINKREILTFTVDGNTTRLDDGRYIQNGSVQADSLLLIAEKIREYLNEEIIDTKNDNT